MNNEENTQGSTQAPENTEGEAQDTEKKPEGEAGAENTGEEAKTE